MSTTTAGNLDREMGRRFAAGDPDALRELFARFSGPVFTVAVSRLGDRALAEEAVQEVFIKAWQHAASFDPGRGFGPWLYQIARRTAADIARRERRRPATTPLSPTMVAADPTTLVDAWEAWEIRRALQQLSPTSRELLRLTHQVGLTQAQSARHLDLPVGTVKSTLHRAYRHLTELLAHLREPA